QLKALAKAADVSVNKLLEGLARWAADCGHAGEPQIDETTGECYGFKPTPGMVWFGEEAPSYIEEHEEYGPIEHQMPPNVLFWLDFREHYGLPPRRHLSRSNQPQPRPKENGA